MRYVGPLMASHLDEKIDAAMQKEQAGPRYEPGDAVEVALRAYGEQDWMTNGKADCMRAALTAAFPELLSRIEALEAETGWRERYNEAARLCSELAAEVDRLRKGDGNAQ